MSGVADYSSTPASNIAINTIGIAGTNSPANFDNALRQLMADLATARTDGALAAMPYATKSAGYTLLTTDRGKLIDCTAALEIELLAAASAGAGFFFLVKANGGAVTLDPNGVEEINGSATSLVVANGSSAIVACNATAWFTVNIAAGSTLSSLEGLTLGAGDMLYATAADTLTDLAIGTAGQFLVTNAGATAPEWASRPTLVSLEGLSLVAGDVLYATAADTLARLAKGTAGQSLRMNTGATAPEWTGSGAPDAVLEDQKSAGTDGGTFTSGAWRTRDLNTEVKDTYSLVSISSNQFTPTVNGWVEWWAPATKVKYNQSRLYNVTDTAVVASGTSAWSDNNDNSTTSSTGGGPVVAGKTYRIEHQCNTTSSSVGFGQAANMGITEVYTRVKFWRT